MSLHAKLKEATHRLHQETEQLLFPGQSWHTLSLDEYRQFLCTQYVFHHSVEGAIAPSLSPPLRERLQWPQRQKHSWIADDLSELDSSLPAHLPVAPALRTEAEALGFLYVTEGSMLGGRMIRKALQNNEQIAPYSSFRFLEGYGADTATFWKAFLQILAREVRAEEEEETIRAARRAFGIFAQSVNFIQEEMAAQ